MKINQTADGSGGEGKYLFFQLAGEEYGIRVYKIKEIVGIMPMTEIPKTPDFFKGVIDLRGKVIPVVDLRLRFKMDAKEYTDRTCIIVVEIEASSGMIQTGIVVDSVLEVLNIKNEKIDTSTAFGVGMNAGFISGMAVMEDGVKILIDIDRVLNTDDIALLEKAA